MPHVLTVPLLLAALAIPLGSAQPTSERILLPVEVVGVGTTTVNRTLSLTPAQSESVRSLWLQVHGLRYAGQASVQVNQGPWIALTNEAVTVAEPGKTFGGIGGGFSTLAMTIHLPRDTVIAGANIISFRFNQTDGLASGYRVLAWNFLNTEGRRVIPPDNFVEDAPENWTPPLPEAASIQAGLKLWRSAPLVASSLPNSPRIQARCADCHALDGRDLKYFNFSNASIITRCRFHGLTTLEGEQVASYIRSLRLPSPGRPWNPPYQPGPGIDKQPISNWASGAGLVWVLDHDEEGLPYLLGQRRPELSSASGPSSTNVPSLHELQELVSPDDFRPDGNLNPRQIPTVLQLPDWSQWLPRVHPKDAWGRDFSRSEFATMYDGRDPAEGEARHSAKPSLRMLSASMQTPDSRVYSIVPAFTDWLQTRRVFLNRMVKGKTDWTPELSNKVYSTQLWQLVKTWEIMQESGLEGRGRELFGSNAESRTWCNSIPAETAPANAHIPNGTAGVGGSALTNEYLTAAWYELQIILNSGNHQHKDRRPVDWVYLIREFRDFYDQTHTPEPVRLLVAVTKALQSADPRLGPDDYSQGWRPDQNVDPRILISREWAPIFASLPNELRRALTESLLAAWMDKNLEYSMSKYLPLPTPPVAYSQPHKYGNVSGGKVWEAADDFRAAGVSEDLIERVQQWGMAYVDRAARIQYR